ncbi:MAG: FtsW/RodA/SpoVE family cell cycle protein [Lachnospiraceae bacterium]|nr:FtsW/RodA/SpoVE family cell cycle protein [Butyrivibrio sp.]MCM1343236.1 FtsW/RodA/SpoVE family cell cycle protein [Muribaculaceae bacterium]MCM1409580.1 FtsW/RodA/SpoVE family cell cycle protein [Lachnospiraceae bacterium]
MREYVTELSKYFINICMIIYTLECFLAFVGRWKDSRVLFVTQKVLIFLIQLLCFADLFLVSEDMQYVFFYVFVQVFLIAVLAIVPMIYENVNRLLLNNLCMLAGTGLCMISRLSFNKAVKQYIIILVSLIVAMLIPYLLSRIRFLKKLTWMYAAVGIGALSLVLLLGDTTYGSKISFSVIGISFQPSEFVKILFIFFLAGALWERYSFARVAVTAVLAGLHVIVLVISTDLGSALIFFVGYVFVVFAATRNYLYLLCGAAGGSGAAYVAYRLFGHVRTRVLAWRDPWSYIDNQGYQITQSLFAIGSGSWFGMGLLQGDPVKIPKVDADFIFSSVCEELGVIFGICLILIMISCFMMMMWIAMRIRDRFYQLIVYGIGIMYIFQIFLTVGGGTKLIPLTGVTLPFISYGGSSIMTTMIMFFIIQGIYIRMQQEGGRQDGRRKAGASGSTKTPARTAGKTKTAGTSAGNTGGKKETAAAGKPIRSE